MTTAARPSSLGDPCACGTRSESHRPVLHLTLPLSVTALTTLTKALSKALEESDEEAFFITDGQHPSNVVYAMQKGSQ